MRNERQKITGKKHPLYIWNEYDHKYSGRPAQYGVAQRRNEPPRWVLTAVGCALVVAILIYFILLLNVNSVQQKINTMQTTNEGVLDSIDGYKTAIADASSPEKVLRSAEELNMVDGTGKSSFSVYVPNRGGNTLTASAGGNK